MPIVCDVVEEIVILANNGSQVRVPAKIDSGAWHSSIDGALLGQLGDYEIIDTVEIVNANGAEQRSLVEFEFVLKGVRIRSCATISDRSSLAAKVLIGREALQEGHFLIDPSTSGKEAAVALRKVAQKLIESKEG